MVNWALFVARCSFARCYDGHVSATRFSGSLVTSAAAGFQARTQPTATISCACACVSIEGSLIVTSALLEPARPTAEIAIAAHTPAMNFMVLLHQGFCRIRSSEIIDGCVDELSVPHC